MAKKGKKTQLPLITLPVILLAALLSACKSDNNAEITLSGSSSGPNDQDSVAQATVEKKLTITGYKCTGCGKCTRFDPEHFAFDMSTRRAEVISKDNLNSNYLSAAIASCQAQAILLQ